MGLQMSKSNRTNMKAMPDTWAEGATYSYAPEESEPFLKIIRPKLTKPLSDAKIIEQVEKAASLLSQSRSDDWPTLQNYTQKQHSKIETIYQKYRDALTSIERESTMPINIDLQDMAYEKSPIHTKAVQLGLHKAGGTIGLMETIEQCVEINDHMILLLRQLADKGNNHAPKNEILYYTVPRLQNVYAKLTSNSEIGERGPLQKFIEEAIKPIDAHSASIVQTIIREMKAAQNK